MVARASGAVYRTHASPSWAPATRAAGVVEFSAGFSLCQHAQSAGGMAQELGALSVPRWSGGALLALRVTRGRPLREVEEGTVQSSSICCVLLS